MKRGLLVLLVLMVSVMLISCSKNSADDVPKLMGELIENVKSYEVDAVMEINENNKTYTFDVNVKYHKGNNLELFKVTLKNRDSNNLQVILKNEEGVFVLNPTLNKSFKFQSDWPLNSSQPYLLQSLVKDVVNDNGRLVVEQDDAFVVETKVNYLKSKDLVTQKIMVNKDTLHPKQVVVYDAANQERIKVLFEALNLKPSFETGEFYVQSTMATVKQTHTDIPVFSTDRAVFAPTYLVLGAELVDEATEVVSAENDHLRYIASYEGDRNYTIIQDRATYADELRTEVVYGDIVILSEGIGFATSTSLTWYKGGSTITIVSEYIDHEMIVVANSMLAREVQNPEK